MIYCVLLNPTIDLLIRLPHFKAGETYKVEKSQRFPVGKAISVALTLKELNIACHVIALIGEEECSEYAAFLDSRAIPHNLIPIAKQAGSTRSNITIIADDLNTSTHLRMPGFTVCQKDLDRLHHTLEGLIQPDDIVVYSGSLSPGIPVEYFFTASALIARKGAEIIIDTSGEPLVNMLLYNPSLIKANLEEMGCIIGKPLVQGAELSDKPNNEVLYELLEKCNELFGYKSKCNIITLAQHGALAFNKMGSYYAVLPLETTPYTVGCGDAFLGGLLAGYVQKWGVDACLRLATACGAANTQIDGPGILKKADVERFLPLVQLKRLK